MSLELTAALLVFLFVGVWKLVRRRTSRRGEAFPSVPDAPPSAEPTAVRMIGDGLGSYWLDAPATEDRISDRRSGD